MISSKLVAEIHLDCSVMNTFVFLLVTIVRFDNPWQYKTSHVCTTWDN